MAQASHRRERRAANQAPLILAIDQGGHATRALAIAVDGEVHGAFFVPIATQRRGAYEVEHDAHELTCSVRDACLGLLRELGSDAQRIRAAGLATQRSSMVCWSRRDGGALSPVISWQDTRAAAELDTLQTQFSRITELTGLVASPHYGASKMRWCLEHLDAVREARRRADLVIGPLSSFLTWHLIEPARALADAANASRTLLWDRRRRAFSAELCRLFGIDPVLLPIGVPSRHSFGLLRAPLPAVPLEVVTGDQSAALFAFGAPDNDTAYVNLGTGAFMQRLAGASARSIPGLLNSVVWDDGSEAQYVVEGTVNGAGSALARVAERVGTSTTALVDRAVRTDADTLPLFLNGVGGLAAPYWQSDFVSRLIDAPADEDPRAHERETLAVLESIAFLIGVNVELADAHLGAAQRIVATGGLAQVDWLCQTLADVTRRDVLRPRASEATARGLAWLTMGRPTRWPTACIERHFTPAQTTTRQRRFQRWRQHMDAACAAGTGRRQADQAPPHG